MAVAFEKAGVGGEFGAVERRSSARDALTDGSRLPPSVYLALVRQLYATGTWVALGLAAAAIFIGGISAWRAADPWLAALALSAGLLIAGLLPLKRTFWRRVDTIDREAARAWERRWTLVSAGYSLAIGAFAARAFLASGDRMVHMMALAICLAGATTILSNSVRPLVLVVQLGGKLVLPSLALAATGDAIYVALALAGAVLVFNVGQIGLGLYGKTVAELEHNARFQTALGNMTHGLCMFGPDHRLLVCNRRYLDMFGFSPDVVQPGVSMRELLEHSVAVGNHPASALDGLHDMITGAMAQAEVAFLHVARGTTFTVTNRPMADGGWVATFEDISERLAAEARLRESERKLATLVANLPGMAYRCAPEAPWSLVYVSEGTEALTGYPASDFTGGKLTWADVMHPDDVGMVEQRIDEAAPAGKSFSMGYRIIHRSGDTRWVFEQGQPVFGPDGDLVALEGFIGDMTDQVTAETKLRRLQTELLQVSRISAMGAMGAAIAHELNQPLAAAANYAAAAGMLLSRDEAPLAQVREACVRLSSEVLRAGEIIRRLRSLAASGEAQVDDEDLTELVEESNVLTLAGARELGVACRFDLARPLVVAADRVQIQQVLLNLVRNSVEAMRDGPRRELVISAAAQDGEARVIVEDSGPGLADEVKANLFAPFTTTTGGMGVGLAICRTIIEGHGGRIWAEDVDGGGTRFCFTLPLASPRDGGPRPVKA